MSSTGAAPRAAVSVSNARAEASRKNGARSRGPKTPAGKARASQNALKHGLCAQKYVVLPQEDAAEFAALHAALVEELAPAGVLQSLLVGRIARAAWRLERAERFEVEVLEFRSYQGANPGVALMRDGNGPRSVETLLRYRGAAMAEFWRALKTLKALQAEAAAPLEQAAGATHAPEVTAAPAPRAPLTDRSCPSVPPQPNASKGPGNREPVLAYATPNEPEPRRTLHEAAARWRSSQLPAEPNPDEPETRGILKEIARQAPPHDPERGTPSRCPTG